MKKAAIIKGGSILGILVLIVSVFANFYVPIDKNFKGESTVNINSDYNNISQPIFFEKHFGVTYLLTGRFHTNKNQDTLEYIEFDTNKISGLFNMSFDGYDLEKFKNNKELHVYLSYGLFKSCNTNIEILNLPINTNQVEKFEIIIHYKKLFKSTGNGFTADNYYPIYITDEEGRICNMNCIHE